MEPAAPTTELVTFPPWPAIPLTAPVTLPASLTTPVTVLAMVPVTPPASAGVRVAVLLTLPTVLPTEVPAGEAALVVPLAADFTGLAEVVTVLEAAEVTCEATGVTAATDPAAEPAVPVTVLDTSDTTEPSPPGEPWVAALAAPASSRPMPNAAHRPPITAPQVYKNTLRVSRHQPFMLATLIHPEHQCPDPEHN